MTPAGIGEVVHLERDSSGKVWAVAQIDGEFNPGSKITADRRKTVRDARDEYVAYLKGLEGSRGEKAPATIQDIETKLDRYLLPALGRLRMVEVTEREIEKLARSARHRLRVNGPLDPVRGFPEKSKRRASLDPTPNVPAPAARCTSASHRTSRVSRSRRRTIRTSITQTTAMHPTRIPTRIGVEAPPASAGRKIARTKSVSSAMRR